MRRQYIAPLLEANPPATLDERLAKLAEGIRSDLADAAKTSRKAAATRGLPEANIGAR